MELVDFIGILGFILTMFVVSSPIPSLFEGLKKSEVKDISLEYLILAAAQGVQWLLYGYKESDFYVKLTNIFVVTAYIIYYNTLLYITKNKEKAIYINLAMALYIAFCALLIPGKICLTVGALVSTCWQFATVPKIQEALRAKDASFINFPVACASFVTFTFWAIYSLLTDNYLMLIPNSLGGLIFSVNLIIYFWATGRINEQHFIIDILKKIFMVESTKQTPGPLLDLNTSRSSYNKL
jgi:uncharacterized protein with PQ loop repeat